MVNAILSIYREKTSERPAELERVTLNDYHAEGNVRPDFSRVRINGTPMSSGIPAARNGNDLFLLMPQEPPYNRPNPFPTVVSGLEDHFGDHEMGSGTLQVQGSRVAVPVHYLRIPETPYRTMNGDLTARLRQVEPTYQPPSQP